MNFVGCYKGCRCRKNGCYDHRCPCFIRNVGCTSKCKCPATVCVNPIGVTGNESNAEPGGQQGTTGTPDETELEPESQIVQPRDTSPSADIFDFLDYDMRCWCKTNGCNDWHCPCFASNVGCGSKCLCPAPVCVNPIGVRGGEHTTFCAVSDVYKAVESNAEPGGQRGTSDTPDEAELVPQSQIVQPRDTSPSAVNMDFANYFEGCWCMTDGCNDWRCFCFASNVGCSSKCLCLDPVCVNPIGVRGGEHTTFCAVSDVYKAVESNAEPGGQRGTSDTPDEAELVPESLIVQPRDTSPLAVNMDFVNYFEGCCCKMDGCNDWRCFCFASNVGCGSKCLCPDPVCVNPIGVRGGEHTTFCAVSDVYKAVESNAEPGGKPGTSDTPDEAELVPQSLIVQPRDTSPLAVNMDFVNYFEGCCCKMDGCNDWRCFCFASNVGCVSKCLCPDPVCVNPIGVRGGEHTTFAVSDVYKAVESNAELGGQRGTSGTPDEAGLVPQSQIVQPSDTSPPAVIFNFLDYDLRCWCKTNGCNDWHCPCFVSNVGCSSKCLCPAPMCVNPIGVRGGERTTFCAVSDVYKAVESNAEPGGQQGTGGTSNIPDEAEPEPEPKRQAVQPRCCCVNTKCLDGYCVCFNGNWLCSEDCVCEGCRNIESNEKEVLMLYKEFMKRKLDIHYKFPFEPIPKRKLGAGPLAKGNLCRCMVYGCLTCSCMTRKTGCTLNCKCKDCLNPFGAREAGVSNAGPGQTTPPSSSETKPKRCHCKDDVGCTSYCKCQGCDNPRGGKGSESNTGSGGADGVGNIPDEAVQTTTTAITEPGQVDTSSMAYCPDRPLRPISEWPGGFHAMFGVPPLHEVAPRADGVSVKNCGANEKLNTGSGGADGVGNIPDEAVQTTTPSITEPGQVDTSSMAYHLNQPLRPISEWPGGFHGLFRVPPLHEAAPGADRVSVKNCGANEKSNTGSGGADGVGNIPDEAVQTTTPSITEPGQVDTSSMTYCPDQHDL